MTLSVISSRTDGTAMKILRYQNIYILKGTEVTCNSWLAYFAMQRGYNPAHFSIL